MNSKFRFTLTVERFDICIFCRFVPGADSAPLLSSARKGLKSRSTHPAGKRTYVPHSPIGNQRLYVLIRTVLLLVPYLLTSLQ